MKSEVKPLLLSLCAGTLLTFLGLFGGVWSLADPFALSLSPMLFRAIALSALLSGLVYALPEPRARRLVLLSLCALLCLLIWYRWDGFLLGAQAVFHKVSLGFHQELSGVYYYELPVALDDGALQYYVNYFLLLSAPLLALWLGAWLSGRGPVWPAVVTVCALPGLGLFLLREPSAVSLGAVLFFLGLTALSRRGFRQSQTLGCARALGAAVPLALVMALIAGVFPQDRYVRPAWAEDLRLAAKTAVKSFPASSGAAQAPGTYSFSRFGAPSFDGHTVLTVQSDVPQERLLLRGWSSAVYTQYGWQSLDDQALDQLPAFAEMGRPWSYPAHAALDSLASGASAQTLSLEIVDVASYSDYYYTPYFPTTMYTDAVFHADAYVTRIEGQSRYSFDYLAEDDVPVGAQVGWDGGERYREPEYREFVYQYYRDVPDELLSGEALDVIRSVADQAERAAAGRSWSDQRGERIAQAQAVAEALASFTRYDLSTPGQPLGQDLVSYFLTTSHRGYCAHYATAATLILREMDIPARFVGGYVADLPGGEDPVPIPDENAHAWVEVYVDGFGWQPVDVTPAGDTGASGVAAAASQAPAASPSPTDEPEASATPAPSATPDPVPSAAPSRRPRETGADGAEEAAGSGRRLLPWLLGALGLAAVLGAVWLQRRLRLALWRKRCGQEDPNAAALWRYRYLEAVRTRLGRPISEEALALAQKAAFSRHTLTEAEGQSLARYAREAHRSVDGAPLGRRLLLRYVWALG